MFSSPGRQPELFVLRKTSTSRTFGDWGAYGVTGPRCRPHDRRKYLRRSNGPYVTGIGPVSRLRVSLLNRGEVLS